MKLSPLGTRVLTQRVEEESVVAWGIILPDMAKTKSSQATVSAVGPGCTSVAKGDSVLLPNFGGIEVAIGKVKYVLIKEEDILGVFK